MDADVAVTDPRVEPITRPREQFISVHPRQGFLGQRFFACGAGSACATHGVDSRSGFLDAMYWSGFRVGKAPGSRFKGSIRDGLNSAVEPGFVAGSRFKGSIREDSNCTAGAWFMGAMRGDSTAVAGSRFEGSVREGLGGTVGSGEAGRDNGRSARTRTPVVRAAVNPCLLAIEPASGPHHRNAATASGKDV